MQVPTRVETSLDWALRYWAIGWNPLAAPSKQKRPIGQWKRWQTERMTEHEVRKQFSKGERSIWIACGKISQLLVLDLDSQEAVAEWKNRLPLDTLSVITAKGAHFYFSLEEGQEAESWSGPAFDIRAEGAGVIAPPSIHASGSRYEWAAWNKPILPAPKELLRGGKRRMNAPLRASGRPDNPVDALEHLLSQVPDEGERNVWLARVAGMYALRTQDLLTFTTAVGAANALLVEPLDEAEVAKLVKSIWDAERSKTVDGELPDRSSGYLTTGGDKLLCLTTTKAGAGVDVWADCDIRAEGVTESDEGRVFDVAVIGVEGKRETQLDTKTLADGRKLLAWMGWMGIHQINPPGAPKLGVGTMLMAYLDAQNPPAFEAVKRLGWHEASESYITLEGRITDEGLQDYDKVKPSLEVRKACKHYQYGVGGRKEAIECLQEILTFHEERAVAMISAWWFAHFLKAQLMARFKLFPICEVTAASESGKTTGFIPLLVRLGGATGAAMGEVTKAGFRDALSPHEGIVRVDDKGDLEPIKDLLRSAPMGGITTKKSGQGWDKQVEIEAHAAILITGQGLGIGKEKAIADRVVSVELGNPSKRMSRRDGKLPQLVDVVAMERRLGELEKKGGLGGEFVQLALAWWGENKGSWEIGTGRMANKHAIMKVGAKLLSEVCAEPLWYDRVVDELQTEASGDTNEDELTISILPYILGKIGLKEHPTEGRFEHDPPTPVFVESDTGMVWFNPEDVASWLVQDKRGGRGIDQRIHTKEGIEQQAKAIGLGGPVDKQGGRWQFKIRTIEGNATNRKRMYWSCWKYSQAVLERVEGRGDLA